MSNLKKVFCLVTMLLSLFGCSKPPATAEQPSDEPGEISVSFVNKVWRVSESSSVARGTLYVFLSEGTLLITSPNSKPLLGTWKYKDGELSTVEEGLTYKVDILQLGADEFRIRSNNPGVPVEITLVPAEEPPQRK